MSGLTCARMFAAIALANFATFVVLNLIEAPTSATVPVYGVALAAGFALTQGIRWRRPRSVNPDRWSWLMAGAALVLLTVPRLPYFLEWLPGVTAAPGLDDYARVPEIATMVLSERYPLRHPGNPDLLFSFYYATLYPMAVLAQLAPALTIKDCIALGNLLYHALMLGSMVGLGTVLLRDASAVRTLMFLVCLFGGLDWLATPPWWRLAHAEWWQARWGGSQISSFYTGMVWAIHHFAAFHTVVLAYAVMVHARVTRARKAWIAIGLLGAAFYASPFSVMSVPLFALAHRRAVGRLIRTPAAAVVGGMMLLPLYLFLGKPSVIGFVPAGFHLPLTGRDAIDRVMSFPVFGAIIPLIEFGGIPFLLLASRSWLRPGERRHLAASLTFFLTTYVVAFVGANDYCMRGMLLPTFVLYALFARNASAIRERLARSKWGGWRIALATSIAVLGTIGTLKEAAYVTVSIARKSTLYWDLRRRADLPPTLVRLRALNARALARDRTVRIVPYAMVADLGLAMYGLEKLVDTKPLAEMERGELELARQPRQGWLH